jgi:MFS family permease
MFERVRRLARPGLTGLSANPNFQKLWAAETITQIGSQITLVALPLAAALALDASAAQMGMLTAAGTVPFLLLGLFAGVWVDRLRRKPIMVVSDLARFGVLLAVPVAWELDALRIELLYAVAFLSGVLRLFFDVAWTSYLPSIVRRDQLVEANSKLQGVDSVAQVGGPGVAGILVGLIGAPLALLVDAASYLTSGLLLLRISNREPAPERHPTPSVRREIGEGLRIVFGNALLRAIAIAGTMVQLFGFMFMAVYILYMVDDLGFSSTEVGLVFSLGGVGAIVGALLAPWVQRRYGIGMSIIIGRALFGVFGLLVPIAVAVPGIEVALVLTAEFSQWMMLTVALVNEVSLRQTIVPDRLLGRASATMRLMTTGIIPVGALVGGFLGEIIGLRATLVVGCAGMLLAGPCVYFSPLRSLRSAEEPAVVEATATTTL